MKKNLSLILFAFLPLFAISQIQQAFNYQAVVRDSDGKILYNENADFFIELLQNGTTIYSEEHSDSTGKIGVVNFKIGKGNNPSSDFSQINWSQGQFQIRVHLKLSGGQEEEMGSADIVAVPFALYAKSSGDWINIGDSILYRNDVMVGIGTESPTESLDVNGDVRLSSSNSRIKGIGGTGRLGFYQKSNATDSHSWIELWGQHQDRQGELSLTGSYVKMRYGNTSLNNGIVGFTLDEFGKVGIGTGNTPFSSSDPYKLRVWGSVLVGEPGEDNVLLYFRSARPWLFKQSGDGIGAKLELKNVLSNGSLGSSAFLINTGGNVGIGVTNPDEKLHVNGRTKTTTLEITGGSDIKEDFDSIEDLEPGDIVVIDENNPGNLKRTNEEYDRKVAGIISGANGINPGISLSQDDVLEGEFPLTMLGRVYVKVTGKVEIGDMLTTSTKSGYAMSVQRHSKAHGAVIGKAMTSLEGGEGMVLVLVNLQ